MQYAQRCLAFDESFSDAHTTVGLVHLVLRQWEKAIEECELAVSLNPNSADNTAILAVALRAIGRVEEALAILEKGHPSQPHATRLVLTRIWQLLPPDGAVR